MDVTRFCEIEGCEGTITIAGPATPEFPEAANRLMLEQGWTTTLDDDGKYTHYCPTHSVAKERSKGA